jgi:hypothetical protein
MENYELIQKAAPDTPEGGGEQRIFVHGGSVSGAQSAAVVTPGTGQRATIAIASRPREPEQTLWTWDCAD